jgi:hypothetical protein
MTPGIPAIRSDFQEVHDTVREYRNKTIAHSQSALATPFPLAILDAAGRAVNVIAISLIHPMPMAMAERFSDLIAAMEDTVDHATQPVLERLRTSLRKATPATISGWPQPEFLHTTDDDFSAASTRQPTPSFTAYWHAEPSPSEEASPGHEPFVSASGHRGGNSDAHHWASGS